MNGLSMGRLKYLFEAARLGSMRAAADFLDVAPSVVSRQIAELEKVTCTPVMETNRRGAKATEAGRLLIEHYRNHLAQEESLASRLNALVGLSIGTVSIGAVQGFADDLMRHVLQPFNARHPGIAIKLQLGSINDILGWLEQDEVHLGLIYGPGFHSHQGRLKEVRSQLQPLCVVVCAQHSLAEVPLLPVGALFEHPFALAHAGFGTRKIVEQIEAAEHRRLKLAMESDHLICLTAFARCGMGATLLPAFAVYDDLQRGTLKAIPVAHPLLTEVQAQLVARRGRALPAAAQRLQRHIVQHMEAFNALNAPG